LLPKRAACLAIEIPLIEHWQWPVSHSDHSYRTRSRRPGSLSKLEVRVRGLIDLTVGRTDGTDVSRHAIT